MMISRGRGTRRGHSHWSAGKGAWWWPAPPRGRGSTAGWPPSCRECRPCGTRRSSEPSGICKCMCNHMTWLHGCQYVEIFSSLTRKFETSFSLKVSTCLRWYHGATSFCLNGSTMFSRTKRAGAMNIRAKKSSMETTMLVERFSRSHFPAELSISGGGGASSGILLSSCQASLRLKISKFSSRTICPTFIYMYSCCQANMEEIPGVAISIHA